MTAPVGVIGGVGPLATVYFMDKVVRLTRAERDQDHVDMVVMQHASIPDRTEYILGRSTDDPGPVMADDARTLERVGVSFIVIPCNTAHHFTAEVVEATTVPVLSIVDETIAEVVDRRPGTRTVGLLATTGTLSAGVYQGAAQARRLVTVEPTDDEQAVVMRVIYEQVKAGRPVDLPALRGVVDALVERGAQTIVLGCTELSVVADDARLLDDPLYVDSLDVLARRTIERAGHHLR